MKKDKKYFVWQKILWRKYRDVLRTIELQLGQRDSGSILNARDKASNPAIPKGLEYAPHSKQLFCMWAKHVFCHIHEFPSV